MKHESGRFARYPRFRFVAFNTIMRQQARKSAGLYARRQADRPDITVEELQDLFFNDDAESHTLVKLMPSDIGMGTSKVNIVRFCKDRMVFNWLTSGWMFACLHACLTPCLHISLFSFLPSSSVLSSINYCISTTACSRSANKY
ncbi:hypothetical protein ACN38_g3047 [Penicillium nordicum]|uniref:Uncharacterized protein n=1 Tax=Penicillium nordicum TaxID=229535 RepID=A0A0M8PCT1_9EURO|nr:hypothetical protein ACN38_g3047 [Penicillium nordicum]